MACLSDDISMIMIEMLNALENLGLYIFLWICDFNNRLLAVSTNPAPLDVD